MSFDFDLVQELKLLAPTADELSTSPTESVFRIESQFREIITNSMEALEQLSGREQTELHRVSSMIFEEAQVRRARIDPNAFIEYVMEDDRSGKPLKQGDMHRDFQNKMSEHEHLLFLGPRGHGKSSQVIGRVLWEIGRNPNLRIKIISNTDDKAADRVAMISKYIKENRKLRRVFPRLRPAEKGQWKGKRIFVARSRIMNDPSVEAFGVLSSGTGGRADLLILDDVVDMRNAILEPGLRTKVIEAVQSDWLAQVALDGRVFAVATLWHKKDFHHKIGGNALKQFLKGKIPDQSNLQPGDWYVCFYAVDASFTPVWPEEWPKERLKKKYRTVGRKAFNRGWRQIAGDDGDKIVKRDWIKFFNPKIFPDRSEIVVIHSYDLAASTKGNNKDSYFARVSVAVEINISPVKIYVLDYYRKRVSFPEQVALIKSGYELSAPDLILIEAIAYQQALPQYLKDQTLLPVVPVTSKPSKAVSLEAASVPTEAGHILFHPRFNGDLNPDLIENGDLIEEITDFPIAEIDDGADAFSQAVNFVQDNILNLLGWKEIEDMEEEGQIYMLGFGEDLEELEDRREGERTG